MRKLSSQKSPICYALIYNIGVTRQQKHHLGTERAEHKRRLGPILNENLNSEED